jgi:Bacterial Ig domain
LGATDAVSDPNDMLGAVTISGLPGDLTNFSGGAYTPGTGTWTGDAASFNALSFNVGEDSVYALTISATTTGAEAGTTSEGYTLTVNPVPEGPKLSGATSTTVSEGAVVILGATDAVSDPNDMLGAVTISGLPGDLTNFSGGAYTPGTRTWIGDAASFNALSFNVGEDSVYALTISAETTGAEAGTTNENYTLTINEAPPVANAGSVTTAANQAVSGVVSVTDPDNDAAFMLNTNPSHGTLTAFDSATGAFTYMPNAGYFGPDSFTFHGTDGYLASNTATESITINAGVAPTGWNFSYDATHLVTLESGSKGTDLLKNTQLGIFTELGGGAGDSYTFTLGGSGASSFAMTSTGDVGTLSTGNADVAGGTNGTLYSLTVQVNDATNGTHTVARPFDVWVGQKSGTGNSTVNLATIEGAASGPTIAYPLHGTDTISAAGLSAPVWFASGTGPDKMTGGSAGNTYLYAAVRDSGQGALADTITNFKAASDKFDFSDITGLTNVQGLLTSTNTQVGAHSIAWILSGSNTLVYGNDTGRSVAQSKAHMEVVLNGSSIGLTASDFIHH